MSAFDPSDPFDNGQPWQSFPVDNGQPWQNVPSTQPVWPTFVDHEPAPTATHTRTTSSTSTSDSAAAQPASVPLFFPVPAASPAPTASSTTHTIANAVSSLFHRNPQETPAPTPAPAPTEGSSSTSTPAQGQPQAEAQAPTQKTKKGELLADEAEDHPPSYESSVVRNIPQIHDNYDHLRGPPGQRGQDIKTRIPLDSTPAEHFQDGVASGSGSGNGSGGNGASGSQARSQYGATTQSTAPPANSFSTTSSKTATATTTAATRLQGQTSHGRNDDDAQHSRDVDRLLGPNSNTSEHEEDEEPKTHWSIVGDRKAWTAFFYIIFLLAPLSLVFFVWSMATLIISAVSMIFPPVGYFVVIAAVTSWRALGRLDLVLLRALVPKDVRERHPYLTFDIFVKPGTEECAHHGIRAASSSAPEAQASSEDTYTTAEGEIRQRRKKPRNVFDKSASHLSASFSNKHTLKTLSYLMIWKLVLAVPVFVFVAVFALLTIPLIFCMLPSMLIISRAFVHWQFRWAVMWLAEKSRPIALP
ncbi:hypothetical protein BGW39_009697 [Mortierella sp. 14UC]|nr:hypothetical protein BGW39_009697 [Mortierella sp. 14UC]